MSNAVTVSKVQIKALLKFAGKMQVVWLYNGCLFATTGATLGLYESKIGALREGDGTGYVGINSDSLKAVVKSMYASGMLAIKEDGSAYITSKNEGTRCGVELKLEDDSAWAHGGTPVGGVRRVIPLGSKKYASSGYFSPKVLKMAAVAAELVDNDCDRVNFIPGETALDSAMAVAYSDDGNGKATVVLSPLCPLKG